MEAEAESEADAEGAAAEVGWLLPLWLLTDVGAEGAVARAFPPLPPFPRDLDEAPADAEVLRRRPPDPPEPPEECFGSDRVAAAAASTHSLQRS